MDTMNITNHDLLCNICGQSVMTCEKNAIDVLPNGEIAHKECAERVKEAIADEW